jgi:hypothetical protein
LLASLAKATKRPSPEIVLAMLCWFPWVPFEATLTRSVAPLPRSCMNTSATALVSPATRFDAKLWKTARVPSAERRGETLSPFPCVPSLAVLMRAIAPETRSRTKTSKVALVSPATRLGARLANATYRPSLESHGWKLSPVPSAPPMAVLARTVVPPTRSWTNTSNEVVSLPATMLRARLA